MTEAVADRNRAWTHFANCWTFLFEGKKKSKRQKMAFLKGGVLEHFPSPHHGEPSSEWSTCCGGTTSTLRGGFCGSFSAKHHPGAWNTVRECLHGQANEPSSAFWRLLPSQRVIVPECQRHGVLADSRHDQSASSRLLEHNQVFPEPF